MTQLIAPYDIDRPTPQPSASVATGTVAPAPQISDAGPRALYAAGQAAKEIGTAADEYGQHLDTVQAQDALNKLRAKKEDLTYGKDGFLNIKGGDVLKRGDDGSTMVDNYKLKLKSVSDDLGSGLSPRARMMFSMRAADEQTGMLADIGRHSVQQAEKYEVGVLKDGLGQDQTEAVRFAGDPTKVAEIADRSAQRAAYFARQQGLPADAAGSAARSNVIRVVAENLLSSGQKRLALSYFEGNKDKLDGPDQVALAGKMKSTRDDVDADNLIASKVEGVTPNYDSRIFKAEAGGSNPFIVNAIGALGKYQMIPSTYTQAAQQTDWGQGKSPGEIKSLLLDPKDGSARQDQLQGILKGQQAKALMSSGVPVNDLSMYMTHFFGTGAGPRFMQVSDSTPLRDGLVTAHGGDSGFVDKVYASNPFLKNIRTVGDLKADMAKRIGFDQENAISGVGFDRAKLESVKGSILTDASVPLEVRTAAAAKIEKFVGNVEATRNSTLKGLDDSLEATTQAMILSPSTYKKGTLSDLASAYDAAGDKSKGVNTRALSAAEDLLLGFSTSTDAAQRRILEALLPGKAKALASGLIAADNEGRAEAAKAARSEMEGLNTAYAAGVEPGTLDKKAAKAVDYAIRANDTELANKIITDFAAHKAAFAVAQGTPVQQDAAIAEMRRRIAAGQQDNATIKTAEAAEKMKAHQDAEFAKDPLQAGSVLYAPDLGPLPPVTDLAARAAYAAKIGAKRGGIPVPALNDAEITSVKNQLDAGTPQDAIKLFAGLSTLPAEQIPLVAARLAGHKDASDPISQSYAAALSFYADRTPEGMAKAQMILQGAQYMKEAGTGDKKAPTSKPGWKQALQDKMGNAFVDMGGKLPATIESAVQAMYVYQMHRAGKQGEDLDQDVLQQSVEAIVGKTITRNGQTLIPPRGVEDYQFDGAVRSITDGDVASLKTLNGSPVTSEKVIRYGRFSNAGKEGQYFVQIPDPANGNAPGYVQDANGKPFVLDIRPLLERASRIPPGYGNEDQTYTGQRRRPVVPTLNDVNP